MQELPPRFEAIKFEDTIYRNWETKGCFKPRRQRKVFSIVMPPPNVTGILHFGHALALTLEDIMVRYNRMKGLETIWVPGMDHAAIATQTVVEKKLQKEKGLRKTDLGREKFLEEVEKFVAQSKTTIRNQIKKIGASCDWSREAYTLDAARVKAVRLAFQLLYEKGLIYRKERVVNWCPRCASTLADDEVEYIETDGKLFYLKYNLEKDGKIIGQVQVATTRPETKLGDTALAVNPSDNRYLNFIDQEFDVNLAGHRIHVRFIADPAIDPNFGTGVVGVTPAHSLIDADLAEKYNLPYKQVIDEGGRIINTQKYDGLQVNEARQAFLNDLKNAGLLEKEENIKHNLAVCYRCGTAIEPLPKLQWFISVNKPFKFVNSSHSPIKGLKTGQEITLKQLMRHVVESGQIKIIPDRFEKIYYQWIDNLRDWCISRQIWFGHTLPVYYCRHCAKSALTEREKKEKKLRKMGLAYQFKEEFLEIVSATPLKKCPLCFGPLEQDSDTLDTWFSSGLWTFSSLGWPLNCRFKNNICQPRGDLARYHPTSVLETGYDILFFWVARMILMSGALVGEIPFRIVYLHGLVRDLKGRKMSKSLGNFIDPLVMIEKYGADALRLSLFSGVSTGSDLKMSEEKIVGYRNFVSKIWNAARFILLNLEDNKVPQRPKKISQRSKEILTKLEELIKKVTHYLDNFEFNYASEALYQYFWHEFCDKIIEEKKNELRQGNKETQKEARYILYTILVQCLKMLHPLVPFVTEAIWGYLPKKKKGYLILERWPKI